MGGTCKFFYYTFFRYTYNNVSFLVHVLDLILLFCLLVGVLLCKVSFHVLVLGLILVFYVHKMVLVHCVHVGSVKGFKGTIERRMACAWAWSLNLELKVQYDFNPFAWMNMSIDEWFHMDEFHLWFRLNKYIIGWNSSMIGR
jgi:hypothetical protein